MTTQETMASGGLGLFSVLNSSETGARTADRVKNFQSILEQSSKNNMKKESAAISNDAITGKPTVAEKTTVFRSAAEVTPRTSENHIISEDSAKAVDSEQTELFEKMKHLLDEVKKVILNTLEISEEELAAILETLGLSMMDLCKPEVLQQIILTKEGAGNDIMALLTNEGMAGTLKELMHRVNGLMEQTGVPEKMLKEILGSEGFKVFMEQKGKSEMAEKLTPVTDPDSDFSLQTGFPVGEENRQVGNVVPVETKDSSEIIQSDTFANEDDSSFEVVKLDLRGDADQHGQGKEEKGSSKESDMTQKEMFIGNLAVSAGVGEDDFTVNLTRMNQMREIANQIIEQIKVLIRPTQTSLEIQLNPEHLGKVNLSIVSKEGVMTAQLTAQTQIAKEAIESQIHMLRESLESKGIKVASIEVSVSEFNFNQSSGMEGGKQEHQREPKGKRTIIPGDEMILDDTAVEMMASGGLMEGSSIDYTA